MSKKSIRLQAREQVAARWAELLINYYGHSHAAKRICRDFDIDLRTARSWLTGEVTPELSAFFTAALVMGVAPVMGVLFPDTHEFEQSKLREDLQQLQQLIAGVNAKLGELEHDTTNNPAPHSPARPARNRTRPD